MAPCALLLRRAVFAIAGPSLILFALLLVGCTPASVVRSATPAAVKGGAEGIADPETQANLAKAMESPEMKEAISALTRDVGAAALDTLDDASKSERMQEIVGRFAARITPVLATSTMGIVEGAVRSAVSAGMAQATSPAVMADAEKLVAGITDAALASIDTRLASDLRDQIGPAFGSAIETSIAPAIDRALTNGRAGGLGREMGRSFILGVNDGLSEVDDTGRSLIDRALNSRPAVFPWYTLLAGIFGTSSVVLVVILLREGRRTRQLRATLLALAAGLDASDREAWSSELVEVVSDGVNDERLGQRLAAVLARRRGGAATPPAGAMRPAAQSSL